MVILSCFCCVLLILCEWQSISDILILHSEQVPSEVNKKHSNINYQRNKQGISTQQTDYNLPHQLKKMSHLFSLQAPKGQLPSSLFQDTSPLKVSDSTEMRELIEFHSLEPGERLLDQLLRRRLYHLYLQVRK